MVKQLQQIKQGLDLPGSDVILPFSAETALGREELHNLVSEITGTEVPGQPTV